MGDIGELSSPPSILSSDSGMPPLPAHNRCPYLAKKTKDRGPFYTMLQR